VYGWTLVLVLILLGGLIAYLGDRIGMRVGRRRLSLFGLRPKHTSVLVTIATGVLIAAASITALSIASNEVRDALFRMREIQQTLLANEMELRRLSEELVLQQEEMQRTVAQRDAARQELAAADARLAEVEREYARVEQELAAARSDLEFQRARIVNLQGVSEELLLRIQEMQEAVTDLKEQIDLLAREHLRMRQGEVAFLANEIILATVIQGGRDPGVLRQELQAFLDEVDRIARRRGVGTANADSGRSYVLPGPEVFERAVAILAESPYRWVVRGVAFENTLIGEPVKLNFELLQEERIYRAGEVIAETVVQPSPGETPGDRILALLGQVRDRAIQRGMITTEEGEVGELTSGDEFFEAIRRVQELGGRARIQAVAVRDTWNTEGPLLVELRVEPL